MRYASYPEAIEAANELFEDLSFRYAVNWKKQDTIRRVIGYLPIYVPREIIHAASMLPVGLFGAGDRIPVVRGDAFFQSYICHLPRTIIELALAGKYDVIDGFLFPSICDVIRNLSGVFQIQFKNKFARYLDFPQNFDPEVGGVFFRHELDRLIGDLEKMNGHKIEPDQLNRSVALYNTNRQLINRLDEIRVATPHKMKAVEHYLIKRAGQTLTVEDHNGFLNDIISFVEASQEEPQDKIRVIVSGAFCEQPPLGLIKTIENAGCYIVDDDFQLGLTWFCENIPEDTADPLGTLVTSYLNNISSSSAVYERDHVRGELMAQRVRETRADGVIFCAPSFCDPALLDRPMLERAMDKHQIKHTGFQYHENLGQFHVIKEQAGTFADMIKLWD